MVKGTILLIAGARGSAEAIDSALRQCGFDITAITHNSGEALNYLKTHKVDSILIDTESNQQASLQAANDVWRKHELPVIFLSTNVEQEFINNALECEPYGIVTKPWDIHQLDATVSATVHKGRIDRYERSMVAQVLKQSHDLIKVNQLLNERITNRMGEINQITDMYFLALEEMRAQYEAIMEIFCSVIELREGGNSGHSRRIATHAVAIAEKLGLDKQAIQDIYYAALLHDVGMMALPDQILNKPRNQLSIQEQQHFFRHCLIGESLFSSLAPLQDVVKIIRTHHEQYNGKGYTDHLSGDAIPIGARILLVVDDHDVYKSGTQDGQYHTYIEARQLLREQKGRKYDPDVVDAYLQWLEEANEQDLADDIKVSLAELRDKDVLSRDLISSEGLILLGKGKVLTPRLIQKLRQYIEETEDKLDIFIEPRAKEGEVKVGLLG